MIRIINSFQQSSVKYLTLETNKKTHELLCIIIVLFICIVNNEKVDTYACIGYNDYCDIRYGSDNG